MQVKLKQNAKDVYIDQNADGSKTSEYFETVEFLDQNGGKEVFVHGRINDYTLEASKYENWKKFNIPAYCFDVDDQEETEIEESIMGKAKNFIKERPKDIAIALFLISLLIIFSFIHFNKVSKDQIEADKKQQIEKQKTAIELLIEKQSTNIQKIGVKMETQKIIKSQIKDLQTKLDQNITEVKTIELENSNIREQIIDETSNFNIKK